MSRLTAWANLHATDAMRWLGLLPPLDDGFPPHVGWEGTEDELRALLSSPEGPKRGGLYGELAAHTEDEVTP